MAALPLETPDRFVPPALSVSELTEQLKDLVEGGFPSVWVSGEISNVSRPQSGHYYFTLKDEQAQIRAVVWRSTASRLRFELEDGLEVICQGGLEVYGPRGTYQLVIRQLEPKGVGALELALRKLRERLAAEGLFAPERKRPLPRFPRRVAVITSPSGAAIRDFLEVLARRWRGVDVLIVPVRVQGDGAGREIADAIALVNRFAQPVDCLVVTRGGGSLEDLWSFNEEVVVRAIHASRVPVVSAVGHEIDVTLSDLVADVRALTPSEAAERIAPAAEEIRAALARGRQRLAAALRSRAAAARAQLDMLASRRVMRKPFDRIHELAQRLDDCQGQAQRAVKRRLTALGRQLAGDAARLESLSPLAVLARGYSVTQREGHNEPLREAVQLQPGDVLLTRFHRGRATSRVESVELESLQSKKSMESS
ncbi:MAG TPA: exodeoxyribonuclease VII large subunit [Pirellulales bacterium]